MEKTTALLLVLTLVLASFFVSVSPVKASSKTIVVPDDYPTIASAVGSASDGDTVFVRKGDYDGPFNDTLRITKSISLIGEDAASTKLTLHPAWVTQWIFASELSGYTNAMEINATGVKVEGFTLLSEGWNIMVNGDGSQINGNIITLDVNLNGCHQTCTNNLVTYCCYPNGTARFYGIINMNGNYSQAAYNQLDGGTIGVGGHYNTVFANSGVGNIGTGGVGDWNLIFNNTLTGSWGSRYRYGSWDGGISIASAGNIVAKNTVIGTKEGAIGVCWGFNNIICSNTIKDCASCGLFETDNAGHNQFFNNYVENCTWGAKIVGYHATDQKTTLYHNNFVGNQKQVNTDPTELVISYSTPNFTRTLNHGGFFDNGAQGNYWSDYTGADVNRDGVGDTPYVIDGNRSDHFPLMTPFDTSNLAVELPSWANLTEPTQVQTPSSQQTLIVRETSSSSPTPSATPNLTANSTQTQQPTAPQENQQDSQQTQPTQTEKPQPLPSPLVIAALIIALVALFGAILSLYLRWRDRKSKQ